MSVLDSREAELELLKSMFDIGDELIFQTSVDPYSPISQIDEPFNSDNSLNFILKLHNQAELSVTLPPGYPSGDPTNVIKPIITLRLLDSAWTSSQCERTLSTQFNEWLDEEASSGEQVLCSAIDWLQNELLVKQIRCQTITDALSLTEASAHIPLQQSVVCLWIVSHHIRSPIKRRLIQEWAAELQLGGCSMPGRPGIVVAEGLADNADTYWRRLRGLQWKAIQLRDREVMGETASYNVCRFSSHFQEVLIVQQSRFAWLHEKGVSPDQFKLVFGIPGRLPNQDKHT